MAQCTLQCFSKTTKTNDKGIKNQKILKLGYITENYSSSYLKEIPKRKNRAKL